MPALAEAAEVVLVRHGQTEWSEAGRHTGRTDVALTEAGRRGAELLRGHLAGRRFARVLVSPLQRAAETCRVAGLSGAAEVRDDLREWDYGVYEGLTTSGIREARPEWSLWRDGCPGGERACDVARRADRIVAELRELRGEAIVFAHGHVLRVLAARWVALPPETGARLALSTGAVSSLGHERENAVIGLWNDTGYLTPLAASETAQPTEPR